MNYDDIWFRVDDLFWEVLSVLPWRSIAERFPDDNFRQDVISEAIHAENTNPRTSE